MATEKEIQDLLALQKKLQTNDYVGYAEKSVLESPATAKEVITNTLESLGKGSAKGILDLVGGWESLYNYLKADKDPEAFKPTRILNAVKNLTGVNLESAPYQTPYNIGAGGAPAAATTLLGVPGLFNAPQGAGMLTRAGAAAKEFGVAGSLSGAAPLITESSLGQLAIQASPYLAKGGVSGLQSRARAPEGMFPPLTETQNLLNIGPLTPGQLTGNRQQLSTEARIAASPKAAAYPAFVQEQSLSVSNYLDKLFDRAASTSLSPDKLTESVVGSFNNYGKALSTRLRSDAATDFNAAKRAGGTVDTTPIIDVVKQRLASIPPETPGLESLRGSLSKILDEYVVPEVAPTSTPSLILGPGGAPAQTITTPGTPAQANRIDIARLQKNLSAWGEAAYSGKADFGKGNIFEGVAPGEAKGIARSVLGAFKTSLDEAIDSGVPGAEQLKGARDKFAKNIADINVFADRPLVKYFDKAPTELVPEDVVVKLRDAKPSQRAILLDVLQNNPDASKVLDTVRRSTFDSVLNKGRTPDAPMNSPEFNINAALAELSKKDGDFNFLFKTPSELNDAKLVVNYMKRVLQSESASGLSGATGAAAYVGAKAVGGNAQIANASKGVVEGLRNLLNSPAGFSEILFNVDAKDSLLKLSKGKTTVESLVDATTKLGKLAGVSAVRAGPMISPEVSPAESSNRQEYSVEELLKMQQELTPQ